MKFLKSALLLLFSILFILLLFQSCYTVRLVSTHGTPMPIAVEDDNFDEEGDFYKDKMFTVLDTVVSSSIFTDNISIPTKRAKCPSGKLFSIEYKNTFGGSLLYLVTFGSKRKVRITYVCMKQDNSSGPIISEPIN